MNESTKRKQNWKQWFLILAGINAGVILLLLLLIFLPPLSSNQPPKGENIEAEDGAEFVVRSSKEDLSQLINGYLDKMLKSKADDFEVILDKNVVITGAVEAFQSKIPVTIEMEPVVQENGDLVLKQEKITLGRLPLPSKKILSYIDKGYPIPDWVKIYPKKESIYVAVTEMDIKSNFKVKVESFDLENDDLRFKFKVPNKIFGLSFKF
ncbi:YpmS family protein [Radiobacillus kanasensis]|uniref:YpmS family protein n=1 Tax=Radiobacillus kanasensis TaxID=2844358 RepID=UPI001E2B724D|nr:YpmS family protein [Radiobacillus kanasensis]UFU01446.1 YpmS family protein [Radiobacillus kanasensis]